MQTIAARCLKPCGTACEMQADHCGISGGASVNQRNKNADAAKMSSNAAMLEQKNLVLRSLRASNSATRLRRAARLSAMSMMEMKERIADSVFLSAVLRFASQQIYVQSACAGRADCGGTQQMVMLLRAENKSGG
jgi:hypothetical protein